MADEPRLARLRDAGGERFLPGGAAAGAGGRDLDEEALDVAEALVALDRGEVLGEVAGRGAVIWEVGGEDGLGTAIERLLPDVRCLPVDVGDEPAGEVRLLVWGARVPSEGAQALRLAQRAFERGCRYAYWRGERDRRPPDALRRGYWLHEVRPFDPRRLSLSDVTAGAAGEPALGGADPHRHWIGWRRLVFDG